MPCPQRYMQAAIPIASSGSGGSRRRARAVRRNTALPSTILLWHRHTWWIYLGVFIAVHSSLHGSQSCHDSTPNASCQVHFTPLFL